MPCQMGDIGQVTVMSTTRLPLNRGSATIGLKTSTCRSWLAGDPGRVNWITASAKQAQIGREFNRFIQNSVTKIDRFHTVRVCFYFISWDFCWCANVYGTFEPVRQKAPHSAKYSSKPREWGPQKPNASHFGISSHRTAHHKRSVRNWT